MPMDFPTNPAVGTYYNGYIWDGTVWDSALQPTAPALLTTAPVYANETARTTAVPSPAEGQLSYLNDINQFQGYAGSSWTPIGGGLIPVSPASVGKDAGTVSVDTHGKITFSGVTTLNLNSLFSSSFTNYRFLADFTSTTTTNNLNLRFRNGSTDYTTSNYLAWGAYYDYNGGGFDTGQSVINGSNGKTGYAYAGSGTMMFGDIIEPFLSTKPTGMMNHQLNGGTMWWRANYYNVNASVDGMTWFFPNATSGTISYYGYKG